MLPNDEQEQSRLDMIHHTWNLQLGGKLICAPIKKEKLRKVLDLGTGTGIWATEIGDEYPDAQVIGVDLVRIFNSDQCSIADEEQCRAQFNILGCHQT